MTSALQPLIGTAADRPLTRAEAEVAFEALFNGPWDYYDKARFNGSISRYEIDQIFVKVVKNPSDQIVGVEKKKGLKKY